MAHEAASEASETYLVEHYSPGLPVDELRHWAARMRVIVDELEREGKPVQFVRSTVVPADESLLCIFEADSEERVREAYARAGIPFDRISIAIPDEG